jgi:hypothetical protein
LSFLDTIKERWLSTSSFFDDSLYSRTGACIVENSSISGDEDDEQRDTRFKGETLKGGSRNPCLSTRVAILA